MTPNTEDGPFSSRGKVARDFGVTTRTVRRWESRPELNFPKVIMCNGRGYFSDPEMADFKRRCAKAVAAGRPRPPRADVSPALESEVA
jgi:hypothetical protein